jgi:hypothetical protein
MGIQVNGYHVVAVNILKPDGPAKSIIDEFKKLDDACRGTSHPAFVISGHGY